MEEHPVEVGYRFHPTDDELSKYYLTNKILGNTKLIDKTIGEINIYDHDPVSLPSLSRNQPGNGMYYFFARKQYRNAKRTLRRRSSQYGKWKPTGDVTVIKDNNGKLIADKTVLVYERLGAPKPKGEKSPWVMHEYQITNSTNRNLNLDSYVICKIFDKRQEADISYGNYSSEPSHPLVSDSSTVRETTTLPHGEQPGEEFEGLSLKDLIIPMNTQEDLSLWDFYDPNTFFSDNNNRNPNLQLQTPYLSQADDEFLNGLTHVNRRQVEHLFSCQELTPPEVEQPDHEYPDGMSLNDLTMPTNAQGDLSLCNGFDSNMSSDNNLNMQLQNPYLAQEVDERMSEDLIDNQDITMLENYNDYMPKKPVTAFIPDYSSESDCDAESISALSYQGTSSPVDSVGSSNIHFPRCSSTDSCKDIQTTTDPSISRKNQESQLTRRTVPSEQEVKEGRSKAIDASIDNKSIMMKTEKKGSSITEDAMERNCKNPPYIYLIILIIGLILLLALSLATSYRFS